MKKCVIYCVTNTVNGKKYVGKTSQTIQKRWRRHCSLAKGGSQIYFMSAIRKYGEDAFTIEEIAEVPSPEWESYLERMWILLLGTTNNKIGYNSTSGGDGFSSGNLNPNRMSPRRGEQIWNFGKPVPEEIRKRISNTLIGKMVGEKNPFFGKKHSEETLKFLSESQKGLKRGAPSEETREKIRQKMLGRVFSPETLAKMSERKKGRKLSPETREKLSISQQARRIREAQDSALYSAL